MDGWTEGWTDGGMDGWTMDGQTIDTQSAAKHLGFHFHGASFRHIKMLLCVG